MENLKSLFKSVRDIAWWVVVGALLMVGGGVFLFYYAKIGYIPQLELESALLIFVGLSISFVFVLMTLVFCMVLPGIAWGEDWFINRGVKEIVSRGSKSHLWAMFYFSFPLIAALSTLLLYYEYGVYAFLPFFVIMAVVTFFFFRQCEGSVRNSLFSYFGYLGSSIIVMMLMVIPVLLVLRLMVAQENSGSWFAILAGFVSLFMLIFLNSIAAANPGKVNTFLLWIVLGAFSLFFIFLSLSGFSRIPLGVLDMYKLADTKVDVVLKEDACMALVALDVITDVDNSNVCVLEGSYMLSRLGREYYFRHVVEGGSLEFSIPSEEVVVWSFFNEVK
ncbi:hypothetical protein IEI94_02140 [Halomonas sp. ML-15]|uniref:hypothetical protein n=1 Tax=Halomonas sp. ML-15 TaxID=2773305 RepID=UPI00174623F8|nr:hypothetical protein [Halomonas sp. ML-15]MBD3894655.1 hypothetical protein [Halomonas sp. ML-15]